MSTESTATKPAASPFAMPAMFGAESVQRAMHDGVERSRAFWDEYARLEAQGLAHGRTMVSEGAKMAGETLTYAAQLAAEGRKLSLEATRRTLEMLAPAAR
jgi:hypothetical protein